MSDPFEEELRAFREAMHGHAAGNGRPAPARAGGSKPTPNGKHRRAPLQEYPEDRRGDAWEPGPGADQEGDPEPEAEAGTPLSKFERKPVHWLMEGYIPLERESLITGELDVGKSTLQAELAARVSTGAGWPLNIRSDIKGPRYAIITTHEDEPEDTILPRVISAGGNPELVIILATVPSKRSPRPLIFPEDLDIVRKTIKRVGAALWEIDPLTGFLDNSVDMYKDSSVRRFLYEIRSLAKETGTAVSYVHHLNKNEDASYKNRLTGAAAWIAVPRYGLLVAENQDNSNERIVAPVKGNLKRRAPSLLYGLGEDEQGIVRIDWKGFSPYTAGELLTRGRGNGEAVKLEEAKTFLHCCLAGGPRPRKEVEAEAEARGIAFATLRRAYDAIGIVPSWEGRGPGGVSMWGLPPSVNPR